MQAAFCLLALAASSRAQSWQSQPMLPSFGGQSSFYPGQQSSMPYPGQNQMTGGQTTFGRSSFPTMPYPGQSQMPSFFGGSQIPMGPGPVVNPYNGQPFAEQQPFGGQYPTSSYPNFGNTGLPSTSMTLPYNSPFGNNGNQGLLGNLGLGNLGNTLGNTLGGIVSPLTQLLQQVLQTVESVVQQVVNLLQNVVADLSGVVTQLLNPALSWSQKQPLIQQIVSTLPQNVQSAFQQLALALVNLSQSLTSQPVQIQQSVTQLLSLPFNQQFRQLPAQQQQLQIQNTLNQLNQQQLQVVGQLLSQFQQQIGTGNVNVNPNINFGNSGNMGNSFGKK